MPMLLAFFLVALFIWIAENIATWGGAWLYPSQENGWTLVSIEKLVSWYLLMLISVVLVTLVHPPRRVEDSGPMRAGRGRGGAPPSQPPPQGGR